MSAVARSPAVSARLGLFNASALSPLHHRSAILAPVRGYTTVRLLPRAHRNIQRTSRGQFRSQSTVAEPEPTPTLPPRRSLPIRILRFLGLAAFSFTLGAAMTVAPAVSVANELITPPTDAETLALFAPEPGTAAHALETQLQSHPLLASLRNDPLLSESRPHLRIPAAMRATNLTGGTLLGDEMIGVPPLMFVARDGSRMVSVHHVGAALCGHPGIVHGGLLATLLDEGLARCCFPALPNKIGMTASLKVDYKAPCKAGQFVVLRAETTKVEGRKAWVKGRLETLVDESNGEAPTVLVEAEALFIEPRQAAQMARIYSNP